tara:strand:- start:2695 stop:3213 length:519 start_codon:yes stop_codon:yes gene_type:complete
MIEKILILIAKKHDTWVDIVCTFGCNRMLAEDITQEMYIKIQLQLEKGTLDIMYKDEINYYYVFKTLKSLFIDLKRKNKNIIMVSLDDATDLHIDHKKNKKTYHLIENQVDFDQANEKVQNALSKMYWYDRKVFEIINSGESISDFSRKSKIKYYSLYWTYKKVKEKLTKLL